MRLDQIAELANVGTLYAFIAVAVCMLVLRVRDPEPRRAPSARRCRGSSDRSAFSAASISSWTPAGRSRNGGSSIWNGIGLVVYFLYGMRASRLAKAS